MNNKVIKTIIFLVVLFLFVIIFGSWFSFQSISTGDWTYKFPQSIASSPLYFYAWDTNFYKGMGSNIIFLLPLSTYAQAAPALLFFIFKFQWEILEKIIWYIPFLFISSLGSFFFFKKIILKDNVLAAISSLIFTTNTYILLTVGGGQIGVGLAYALIPLVTYGFASIINALDSRRKPIASIIAGITFSVQLMLDSRIAYISVVLIALYYIVFLLNKNFLKLIRSTFFYFTLIPGIVILFLNFFWLVPFILIGKNPLTNLGTAYTDQNMVTYLSFAKFENTISLLHPNWPENIFGKTTFLDPSFLILPVLAFSSLLFISKIKEQKTKSYILFFALLALIGAFLAKGANEPFGEVYLWMFNHIPGFIMFRDPSKWYTLVAISYSILIPFSVWNIYGFLSSKIPPKARLAKGGKVQSSKVKLQNYVPNLFLILTSLFLLLLIRPALSRQLTGTFVAREVPKNYIELADFLTKNNSFYRTLWIPNFIQFSYYSTINPIIPANDFYSLYSEKELINKIKLSEKQINSWSIKYIIVPDDIQGKIFMKDRKYDDLLYKKTVTDLEKIAFLKKKKAFGKIAVFEVLNPNDHFYFNNQKSRQRRGSSKAAIINNQEVTYKYISPVVYKLEVKNVKKGDVLVFSENYDVGWVIQSTKFKVQSTRYDGRFNSFILPQDGDYSLRVYYTPQDYVNIGVGVSGISLVLILSTLIYLKKKKI